MSRSKSKGPHPDLVPFGERSTLKDVVEQQARLERSMFRRKSESLWFNASSLGYCPRRQVLQRGGVESEEEYSDKTLANFAWGEQLHYFVRNKVKRMGLLISEETYLRDEDWGISGRVDLIWGGEPQKVPAEFADRYSDRFVEFLQALRAQAQFWGPLPVVGDELKSAKSYAMERAYSKGPQQTHMFQAAVYELIAERHPDQLPVPVDLWSLTMVGKDTTGVLTFQVTPEWKDRVRERVDLLNYYWEAPDVTPMCLCGTQPGMPWEKGYCRYLSTESRAVMAADPKAWKDTPELITCCEEELLEFVDRNRQPEVEVQVG